MNKKCFKCGDVLPLDSFYKHKGMLDGHLNKCKICTKKDTAVYAENNLEKVKNYKRKWAKSNQEKHTISNRNYRASNPKKYAAHNNVVKALKSGDLIKPLSCECCGVFTEALHAHHSDYNKPLDVEWLCVPCHSEWHKNNDPIV